MHVLWFGVKHRHCARYITAERTRMLTQALLELRSELARPLIEGAGRALCSQAQRARYVLAGIRVAPTGVAQSEEARCLSTGGSAFGSEHKEGKTSAARQQRHSTSQSNTEAGSPLIAPSLDATSIPGGGGVDILELLEVDSLPQVVNVKEQLVSCVTQAETAVAETTAALRNLLEQAKTSAKEEVLGRAKDQQERDLAEVCIGGLLHMHPCASDAVCTNINTRNQPTPVSPLQVFLKPCDCKLHCNQGCYESSTGRS